MSRRIARTRTHIPITPASPQHTEEEDAHRHTQHEHTHCNTIDVQEWQLLFLTYSLFVQNNLFYKRLPPRKSMFAIIDGDYL